MVVPRTTSYNFWLSGQVRGCPYLEQGFSINIILELVSFGFRFVVVPRTTGSILLVVQRLFGCPLSDTIRPPSLAMGV